MRHAVAVLAHPDHAGMLRALQMLRDHGGRHGWSIELVTASAHPLLDEIPLRGVTRTVIPGIGAWRRLGGRLRAPFTVHALARRARAADLLYSVTLSSLPFCLLAGRIAGVPTVVHSYSSYGDAATYRKLWLPRATDVLAPSEDSLRLAGTAVGGFGPGVRARVVRNGMEVDRLLRLANEPSPVTLPPSPRIGMVGNLDWRKNPALVVEAAARVRRHVPSLHVLLIGSFKDPAYERQVRERITALGLDAAVTITGFVSNPFPLVAGLDVLVHPALRDPFPLALLEGMALERPIVASAVGGIPEMFVDGSSGLLVPPDDADRLAATITELLQNDARRHAIGRAAGALLRERYTPEQFTAAMCAAFDDAVQAAA